MRTALLLLLLTAGCGREAPEANGKLDLPQPSGPPVAQQVDAKTPTSLSAPGRAAWESATGQPGTALRYVGADGKPLLSLACSGSPVRLAAHVPAFSPIGSEDRFSLGLGKEPVTLVADPARQSGGGVTGEGPVPNEFERLLKAAGEVSAVYGSSQAGPYPPPPKALADRLAEACSK